MAEVIIDKVISNGYGLTRDAEGRVIFMPGALAGERWRLTTTEKRKGTWWGTGDLLEASPQRVEPNCPHFQGCGGCALLHVRREHEMAVKVGYLQDVLSRLAHLQVEQIEVVDFPAANSRIRGKLHVDAKGHIGFRRERSHSVEPIRTCSVLPESMVALLPMLSTFCEANGFEGELYFLTDSKGEHPIVALRGSLKQSDIVLEGLVLESLGGLSIRNEKGKRVFSFGETSHVFRWGEIEVRIPPTGFLQSNPASWPTFFELVHRYFREHRPKRTWDVYAGAGFLCSQIDHGEILASEPNRDAFDQLRAGLKTMGMPHRVFQGNAESAIDRHFFQPNPDDGLILDPPRDGLSNKVRQWVVDHGPDALLYFSCDLGSFARDLRHLGTSYGIEGPLVAMNVNPGTLRLELGAILTRS